MPAVKKRLPLAERWQPDFGAALAEHGLAPLVRATTTTLQVNVGKLCNQACHHCHVEAGPRRTEIMSPAVAERVIALLAASPNVSTLDLTGGAPELNPSFRWLVAEARRLGRRVIDRCNLTILFEPGMADLAAFLAAHGVEVVASLPCYSEKNVEDQRGHGVFGKSIAALRQLNALGYGTGSALRLDLVYNPNGAFLPPAQAALEARYRDELVRTFAITFDRLYTITNVPIARFADFLDARGDYERYMSLLVHHVNPATVPALMCRSLVSVGWEGALYDCDFNQMLELPLGAAETARTGRPTIRGVAAETSPASGSMRGAQTARTVFDIDSLELAGSPIATGSHCFACTAGNGSSCGGSLA